MFNQIAPQRAQHSLGFIVQIGGRYSVQYLDKDLTAEIKAALSCTTVPLFIDTLAINKAGKVPSGLTPEQAKAIIHRIEEGLDCLGVEHEICRRQP